MYRLTARQLRVARLISEGCSNIEIAERLGIAERTVRAHSDAIKVALEVSHKTQIPGKMKRLGYLDNHEDA